MSSVLVKKSVVRTLFGMAAPMLAGTFAMNAYNLTDTLFVSWMGTLPLAAMAFTFPVVMLLTCVARGIGSGITTLVSHAIGRNDDADAARFVMHGMILTLAVAAVMSVGGYLLIGPIFRRLGVDAATMPLVGEYMRTWFMGAALMTLPMVGNGLLISAGDSKAASWFMVFGTILNLYLDPILIYGLFGLPTMGIRGAALATVIAQGVSSVWMIVLLTKKHRLIRWRNPEMHRFFASLRRITTFAVPSILSMILMPISATVITKILSGFGNEAVAATGTAGRLEMFAFMIPMALGISLTPFVSQNFGAERLDRLREAQKVACTFAIAYGALTTAAFCLAAPWLAAIFTDNSTVSETLISYIRIVSFGYGLMEVHRYSGFFMTGMHRPNSATALNVIRIVVLLIPLSYLGAWGWGVTGVFGGRLITDIVVGLFGMIWVYRALSKADKTAVARVRA